MTPIWLHTGDDVYLTVCCDILAEYEVKSRFSYRLCGVETAMAGVLQLFAAQHVHHCLG